MSDPSGQDKPGDSWERRAADLANDVQRWLIKSSARSMRDELGDQVKKAFRSSGSGSNAEDVWSTATTEPPDYLYQAPECAWCPVCRAARRLAQAQSQVPAGAAAKPGESSRTAGTRTSPAWAGASDVLVGAARDALAGLDAILSYRPGDVSGNAKPANGTADQKEPEDEPDHRS
jgi:hypothetical protein